MGVLSLVVALIHPPTRSPTYRLILYRTAFGWEFFFLFFLNTIITIFIICFCLHHVTFFPFLFVFSLLDLSCRGQAYQTLVRKSRKRLFISFCTRLTKTRVGKRREETCSKRESKENNNQRRKRKEEEGRKKPVGWFGGCDVPVVRWVVFSPLESRQPCRSSR